MTIEDFAAELMSEISIRAAADSNFTHAAFVDVASEYLEVAGEISELDKCFLRANLGQKKLSLDGYFFDQADGSLRLFVAELLWDATLSLTDAKAQFRRLENVAEALVDGRLGDIVDESSPVQDLISQYQAKRDAITTFRMCIATNNLLSGRATDILPSVLRGVVCEYQVWDLGRFYRLSTSASATDVLTVNVEEFNASGIPCLEAGDSGEGVAMSYLCVVPGSLLADLYDSYGSRLLEGNVRAFLSTKMSVNKAIRNTVLHRPALFFSFNNGLSVTASSAKVTRSGQGLFLTELTDPQIVNGGQTTASLSLARRTDRANLDEVFVPMKLTVVEEKKAEELIPEISRSANSQSKVNDADFFSNHPYHRMLEEISRRIYAPAGKRSNHQSKWFYERSRGQYLAGQVGMTSGQRRVFQETYPKVQLFTKTDLAKSELLWLGEPYKVSRGAQVAFSGFASLISEKWDMNKPFVSDIYFKTAIAKVIVFRRLERLIAESSWYENAFRNNIVAYTLSFLALQLQSRSFELDFMRIWQMQGLELQFESDLTNLAEMVYGFLIHPPAGQQNVSQWAKREECWSKLKKMHIELGDGISSALIDKQAATSLRREGLIAARVDSDIAAQVRVISVGNSYWQDLLFWAEGKKLLSLKEEQIVRFASVDGNVPSERQSVVLLEVQSRLQVEGFKPFPEVGPR